MNRYIGFVLRRPVPVLIGIVLVTLILAPGMLKLQFDNAIEVFMPRDDPEYVFYNRAKDTYGDNGRFIISAVYNRNLWHTETFRKMNDLLIDLEEYKDFNGHREDARLQAIDAIIVQGTITYADFIGLFRNDPAFRRLLERKCTHTFGTVDLLTGADLKKLRAQLRTTRDFKQSEIIDDIVSPLTMQDITGKNDMLETYDILARDTEGNRLVPETREEMQAFRKKLLRNPAFRGSLYRKDPRTGAITDFCVLVKFINLPDQDPIAREIKEIFDYHRDRGLDVITTEVPIINIHFHDYMHRDLYTLVPIVMLVVVIIFYLNFKSFRGVFLPFATLSLAELWILGLMGYLGHRISSVDMSLPPLMIAVGSSYSIHILNQYYADFKQIGLRKKKAGLQQSMSHISLTVLLAGLTTFIAFMTLTTSRIYAIREWGFFSAIGVLFAVFISCSLIPAGLTLLPHATPRLTHKNGQGIRSTIVDHIITFATRGAIVHYRKVLIVVGIVMVFSILGLLQLKVETVFLNYLKEHDSVRTDVNLISDKFGGCEGYSILIDSGKTDGIKNPLFLNTIENFRTWLESGDNRDLRIGRTDSFSDFIKTMHMAMNNDERRSYRIPHSNTDIVDYLEIYGGDDDDSDGRFDEFESFVDGDYKTCNVLARLYQGKGDSVGTRGRTYTAEKISDYLEDHLPGGYSYTVTGFPMMEIKLVQYVVRGQLQSLFLCLIVVGVIVILLFNQLKAGLLALIPMSVAVILNFGIMGWLGINLDMVTSLIAAITIGIGVDDTIHFLNTFRHNRAKGLTTDETITLTLAVAGKAILFTSIALILGFLVFTVSSFIPVILFGLLMAMTMVATTLGALVVLPSVIKATGINLRSTEPESWFARRFNLDRLLGLKQEP